MRHLKKAQSPGVPDFGVLGLESQVLSPRSQVLGPGSLVQSRGLGSWVLILDYVVFIFNCFQKLMMEACTLGNLAMSLRKSDEDVVMIKFCKSQEGQIHFKTNVLKNFTNFTEKYLCWSLFLINYRTPPVAASGRGLLRNQLNKNLAVLSF